MNYTYILECKDGTYYTGWTNNLKKRLKDHNDGKGAKYTKARLPVSLVYYEEFQTKEEAMRREYAIKRMTRNEKNKLFRNTRFSEVFIYAIDKEGNEKEFRVSEKTMKTEKFKTGEKVAEEREGVLISLEIGKGKE